MNKDFSEEYDTLREQGAISISSAGDFSGMKEWFKTPDGQQWLVWWEDGKVTGIEKF